MAKNPKFVDIFTFPRVWHIISNAFYLHMNLDSFQICITDLYMYYLYVTSYPDTYFIFILPAAKWNHVHRDLFFPIDRILLESSKETIIINTKWRKCTYVRAEKNRNTERRWKKSEERHEHNEYTCVESVWNQNKRCLITFRASILSNIKFRNPLSPFTWKWYSIIMIIRFLSLWINCISFGAICKRLIWSCNIHWLRDIHGRFGDDPVMRTFG